SLFGFARYRLLAFYGALGLMTVFTAYIIILLQFSTYIPCSCGGILEQLGWHEHLIFNFIFLGMALLGVFLQASLRKEYTGLQPYLLLRLSIRPKIIVLTTVGVLIL